jgi:hypothetical protein
VNRIKGTSMTLSRTQRALRGLWQGAARR